MAPNVIPASLPTYSSLFSVPNELSKRETQQVSKPSDPTGLVVEAWAQGYMVGSLVIMAAITVANMRRSVLLHKLILLELILGTFHGTFIFTNPPVYGWYLSTTAIFLNMSWSLHNVIAWMKTKPFLSKKWSWFYIGTVALAQPYWVVEIYANFTYFNNINDIFLTTRPYEALFRDPWWIFTTINLFYNIVTHYRISLPTVIIISPRFGVLLVSMLISICFIIVDICSVTGAFSTVLPDGLNPFWKLAFVFKCLTDSIILDDFKTALDRLMKFKMQRERFGVNQGTFGATAYTENDTDGDTSPETNGRAMSSALDSQSSAGKRRDPLGEDALEAEYEAKKIGILLDRDPEAQITKEQHDQKGNSPTSVVSTRPMASHIENYEEIDLPTFLAQDNTNGAMSKSKT